MTIQGGKQQLSLDLMEGMIKKNAGSCQIWKGLTRIGQAIKIALEFIINMQPQDDVCVVGIRVKGMFCTTLFYASQDFLLTHIA